MEWDLSKLRCEAHSPRKPVYDFGCSSVVLNGSHLFGGHVGLLHATLELPTPAYLGAIAISMAQPACGDIYGLANHIKR